MAASDRPSTDRLAIPDRSWVYLRKSQDEEHDPEILAKHRALLLRVAAADGVTIRPENIYEEIGSAERIESRPAFQGLLAVWERLPKRAGGVIYVTELSRLSRGLLSQQGRVQDALMRTDVHIRTPSRRYDLSLFEDRLQFGFHGLISNAELELFKQRMARARDELRRQGRIRNGEAPWGYRWVKGEGRGQGRIEPDPATFPLLREMCRDAFTLSTYRLCEKYQLPRWRVLRTLRSPTICGWPAQVKAYGQRLDRDEYLWPEHPGDYEPAISRADWEALQEALIRRRKPRAGWGKVEGWCRHVVCFVGDEEHLGHARCGAYNNGTTRFLTYELELPGRLLYVAREDVHAASEAELKAILTDPKVFAQAEAASRRGQDAIKPPEARPPEMLERERGKAERQLVQLFARELEEESPIQQRAIAELRRQKEVEIKRLEAELQAILRPQVAAVHLAELAGMQAIAPDLWEETWAEMEIDERAVLVDTCLARVDVVIERVASGRAVPWRREVVGVVRQEWCA